MLSFFFVVILLFLFRFCVFTSVHFIITKQLPFIVMRERNDLCKILSLNVRGIRDVAKRRGIFSYLKDEKAAFYFLQETYSEKEDETVWKKEWGGDIIFSHVSNRSRGVCILIDPSENIKSEHSFKDSNGRIVLTTIEFNGFKLSLCNIYAHNNLTEQIVFIQELNGFLMDKSEITSLIVGGDWNCTLAKMDKSGGSKWKAMNSRNGILMMMEMFDLIDVQRKCHPNLQKFSYFSKALGVRSRIDYFLITENLKTYVKTSDIRPSIAPDHSMILLVLSLPEPSPRGPGFWKFNIVLLEDDEYKEMIRELYPSPRKKHSSTQDKQLFWELTKMEIRTATISFSKGRAKTTDTGENEIKRLLAELDSIICNSDNLQGIEVELKNYDNFKRELEGIYDRRVVQRCFDQSAEQGERPTKYFFNLERKIYNKKVISKLETENGTPITGKDQILTEIEHYYQNLYSSESMATLSEFHQFTRNIEIPKLTEENRTELEGPFTLECKEALASFRNGKSPGEDGFTVEFYTEFFDILGIDLVESLKSAYEKGHLSISQRRGVITLLPKEGSPLIELKNWRPITLLNVDYKIASKAIARRIEPMLPRLIHGDQTGFIKGRYIGENIRLINDLM